MQNNQITTSSAPKWALFSILCLFLIYAFIQFSIMNSLSNEIIKEFNLNNFAYGTIASLNLYVDFLFIIPAAILVDRISAKKVLLSTVLVSLITTLAFMLNHNLITLALWRMGVGLACTATFSGSIKMATFLFERKYLGLTSGLILASVMIGDILSQAPMFYLLQQFGLTTVLNVIFGLGLLTFGTLLLLPMENEFLQTHHILDSLKATFANKHNWYAVLFACFMNFSLVILGAIWGQIFLIKYYGLSNSAAAMAMSLMFLGNLMGAPLFGALSDRIGKRGILMFSSAVLTAITFACLVFVPTLSMYVVYLIFYIVGFLSSSQSLCYASLVSTSKTHNIAISISMMSSMLLGSIIAFQYLFSYLISNNISNATLIGIGGLAIVFAFLFLKNENKCHQAIGV